MIGTIALSAVVLNGRSLRVAHIKRCRMISLDKASFRPTMGPKSEIAVLLDVTDPISEATSIDLKTSSSDWFQACSSTALIDVWR